MVLGDGFEGGSGLKLGDGFEGGSGGEFESNDGSDAGSDEVDDISGLRSGSEPDGESEYNAANGIGWLAWLG